MYTYIMYLYLCTYIFIVKISYDSIVIEVVQNRAKKKKVHLFIVMSDTVKPN